MDQGKIIDFARFFDGDNPAAAKARDRAVEDAKDVILKAVWRFERKLRKAGDKYAPLEATALLLNVTTRLAGWGMFTAFDALLPMRDPNSSVAMNADSLRRFLVDGMTARLTEAAERELK